MGRKAPGKAQMDVLAAVWEYLALEETTRDLTCRVALYPSHRKGIFHVAVQAFGKGADGQLRQRASWGKQWPDSSVQTLEGCILEGAVKLGIILDEQAADEAEVNAPKGVHS